MKRKFNLILATTLALFLYVSSLQISAYELFKTIGIKNKQTIIYAAYNVPDI